jgi:hypothetical protein
MTEPVFPAEGQMAAGVVDGVDLDAVAAAARSCAAVDDLCSGAWGGVVSYLPGRQVAGVRVARDHVVISVRARWGIPVSELAGQIRAAVTSLVAPRRVDVVVADLAESGTRAPADAHGEEGPHGGQPVPATCPARVHPRPPPRPRW